MKQNVQHPVSESGNKPDYAISAIRFISMLLIITCHFMQYLEMELAWWFNVGVQIFFTMSGFLYGQRTIYSPVGFVCRQLKKILIPYWCILFVVSVVHKLFLEDVFSWGVTIAAFFCVGRIPGMEHLWFVQYILICYLLLPYLLYIKRSIKDYSSVQRWAIIAGLFVALQFVGFTFKGYGMIPNRISCFAAGVFLPSGNRDGLVRTGKIICPIAIVLNIVRIFGVYILNIEQNLIFDLLVKYAHGFLGIAAFLFMYCIFSGAKSGAVLKFSDRYSYHIYLVHQVFILGPLSLMKLMPNVATNIFAICCCIFLAGMLLEKSAVLINTAIGRMNQNIMKRCRGGMVKR